MSLFGKKDRKDSKQEYHSEENTSTVTRYQCPMKCEGEKTYDQPGRCPVCKMYLQPVK